MGIAGSYVTSAIFYRLTSFSGFFLWFVLFFVKACTLAEESLVNKRPSVIYLIGRRCPRLFQSQSAGGEERNSQWRLNECRIYKIRSHTGKDHLWNVAERKESIFFLMTGGKKACVHLLSQAASTHFLLALMTLLNLQALTPSCYHENNLTLRAI